MTTEITEIQRAELPDQLEFYEEEDPYLDWQKREGVKVIADYRFEDMNTVELGAWERKGGKGAVIVIPNPPAKGSLRSRPPALVDDFHLIEISPGGKSEPEHHMYEETVYVISGRGTTNLTVGDGHNQIIEWKAGSYFTIPLNVTYQHFNASGTEPARYGSITNLPVILRQFNSYDFIFNNPFQFTDRYSGNDAAFFNGDGKVYRNPLGRNLQTIWKTNFVPDVDNMPLWTYASRGASGTNTHFRLDGNVTHSHVSEFPVGTYKKAHMHGPGAHLVICGGVGFSLFWWPDNEELLKVDWKKGSLVSIPYENTYHQHFNTGTEPARYLAMGGGNGQPGAGDEGATNTSIKEGGYQVEYEDEDPEIHKIFEAELKEHGAECRMKDFIPACTGVSNKS
jgi:uncharacterized RmlC-like cupin family protein